MNAAAPPLFSPPGHSSSSSQGFSASFVRVVADYVQAQDRNAQPILDLLGLSASPTLDDGLRVPAARLSLALAHASQLMDDEHIGLHVASLVRPAHLGSLGYALMSCTVGGDGLALFNQLQSLLCTELRGHFSVVGPHLEARHEALGPLPDDYHFWSFFTASRLGFARWVSGRDLVPARVDLPCDPPKHIQPFLDFIKGPVHFRAAECRELMPADWLSWTNPNADPPIHDLMSAMARRQWQTRIDDKDALRTWIAQAIRQALDRGDTPTLSRICDELTEIGVSPGPARHVQRQLSAQGLNFKGLVEQARQERALMQLRLTDLPLAQIAAEAGYAETSSFHRAVRRWTGMTPMAVREAGDKPTTTTPP
ncbi:AraC family transcriptional regulator [Aquabacterium sp.]|uniref:AraC family transcriptional regulator n=1 Tax=Aquabacterium sp. TaxID=1872578 RepID=UPI002487C34A|nr:AraC family transcriptional regulator [Aquabacterium sp.]MDI1258030.1 AraC family transcriptional regulator ligand-binding domain-containing protein [Aquabacterium sp.]